MPEYYLVQEENANVYVEGAEKQDDDNKRVHMGCFSWFRRSSRHPQVRGPFFMTSGTCDKQPVRLETGATWQELTLRTRVTQCRSPRSLPTRLATLQTGHVPIRQAAVLHAKFSPVACLLLLLETT